MLELAQAVNIGWSRDLGSGENSLHGLFLIKLRVVGNVLLVEHVGFSLQNGNARIHNRGISGVRHQRWDVELITTKSLQDRQSRLHGGMNIGMKPLVEIVP